MSNALDMTRGKPLPLLVKFGVPLMLSYILQQLYSLCDSVIVGRLIGVEAFAAVGSASFLSALPLEMLLGLTQGFGVVLAQRFGAGDEAGLRRSALLSSGFGCVAAVLMTAMGLCFLTPLLTVLRTPTALMEMAAAYLRVMFFGLIATALYNVAATLLRAMGDSRTPLVALVASTLLNIVLDYLLVAWGGMGVEGVALATVLATVFALGVCAMRLHSHPGKLPPPSGEPMRRGVGAQLLKMGLPPMFRNGVVAVGGLYVQSVVNGFGVAFVAGMTAARRYFTMMVMVSGALEGALATFVGQNAGAGRTERIEAGTRTAVRLALVASIFTGICTAVFARPLIALLVTEGNAEVVQVGVEALRVTSLLLPSLYLLCLYRATLQSMGDAVTPTLSGFTELALRILCVSLLPSLIGRSAAYLADGLGWVAAMILLMGVYYWKTRAMWRAR